MLVRKFIFIVIGLTMYLCVSFAYNRMTNPLNTLLTSDDTETTETKSNNNIQVALLLDTSGSMSGLIEQAKSQLWNILNELARTEKEDGNEATLEIALYEYGNPSKTKDKNQIHQLVQFTTDMDLVSEKLFALNTDGGDEYCGAMINTSLEELEWKNNDALKIIYIAGNEGFTQGPVNYETACGNAKEKDIVVNTIFCGDYNKGINLYWKAGAIAGNGEYLNINHNRETVYIQTPYDDQINRLNSELNETYIPYGKKGKLKQLNQISQDANASSYSSTNFADRTAFKSSKKSKANDWDLVDAYKDDANILSNVEMLADSLQGLDIQQLEARIEAAASRRASIQQEIQELDKKRRSYKAEQSKNTKENSLQKSMIKTIQKQAKKKGYKVKE